LQIINLIQIGYLFLGSSGSGPNSSYYNYTLTSPATDPRNLLTVPNIIGHSMTVTQLIDHGGSAQNCFLSSVDGASGVIVYQCVIGIPNNADQINPLNSLPVPDFTGVTLPNNWTGSSCLISAVPVQVTTTKSDCVNFRRQTTLASDNSRCQAVELSQNASLFFRIACSSIGGGLVDTYICPDGSCQFGCVHQTALPQTCAATGFGGGWSYTCSAPRLFSFLTVFIVLLSLVVIH